MAILWVSQSTYGDDPINPGCPINLRPIDIHRFLRMDTVMNNDYDYGWDAFIDRESGLNKARYYTNLPPEIPGLFLPGRFRWRGIAWGSGGWGRVVYFMGLPPQN